MSTPLQIAGRPLTVRLARVALWFIVAGSALVIVVTLVCEVAELVGELRAGTTTITLIAEKALPKSADSPMVHIASGTYDTATVALSHVPGAVAVLGTLSAVGQLLAHAALAAALGLISWRVIRPRMFRRSLSLQFTSMGLLVFFGGVLWQVGGMFASGLAAVALNGSGLHGFWPLAGRLDLTYIVMGFAFVAIGLAFEYGGRLQKDAEGLV